MADVQKRVTASGELRWDVRYRDDARRQRKRSFERKVDALRFGRAVETDLLRGDWIDPRRSQEPVATFRSRGRSAQRCCQSLCWSIGVSTAGVGCCMAQLARKASCSAARLSGLAV